VTARSEPKAGFPAAPFYTPYNCSTLNGYQLAGSTGSSSNPFKYSSARDEWLACWGIAGRISSNCRDITGAGLRDFCYSVARVLYVERRATRSPREVNDP
jgi:ribosome modulation factor